MRLIQIPTEGTRIEPNLACPDHPIIPFIEGDGIGIDITPVMQAVTNAAVHKAYGHERQICWLELFCGDKAIQHYGERLPQETLELLREYGVSIKGPLSGSCTGSQGSLNTQLRQELGLYACLRPVRGFYGLPTTALKTPDLVNMVLFHNTLDGSIATTIHDEWIETRKVIHFLQEEMGAKNMRSPETLSTSLPAVSREGTERLVRLAIQYAIDHNRKSVTLVHQGAQPKAPETSILNWGYEIARNEFGATHTDQGCWLQLQNGVVIKDMIADAFLQQAILHPCDYDVIATLNLNGDYLSDALAAKVGEIGLAPGAHLSDTLAMFEATHGTAPKYAGQDKVNPSSLILSAEMLLRHIGWKEAAERIAQAFAATLSEQIATYDFARLMPRPQVMGTHSFGMAIIARM